MRKLILSAFTATFFISSLSAEVVVFQDSFDGGSLDGAKWNTLLPYSDSSVSVGSGAVNLVARGTIVTKTSFTTPYTLTGSFINQNNTSHSAYSVFQIYFRTSGNYIPLDIYKNLDGFNISFWPMSAVGGQEAIFLQIDNRESPYGETKTRTLEGKPFQLTTGREYFFSLTDSGTGFTFDVDGQRIFDYTSSVSFGSNVGFASRETMANNPTYTGDVLVNGVQVAVPEPSSLSLLALGGGAVVMCRRRRN
jgi:hypothetical protein